MIPVRLRLALAAAAGLVLQDVSSPHGGTFRAPIPGPGTNPGVPSTGVGQGRADNKALTQAGAVEPDVAGWQRWWAFNRDPFLDLKAKIHAEGALTLGDELYLGQGQRAAGRVAYRPSDAVVHGKVVPALLSVLEKERNKDLLSSSLIALAKIGDAPGSRGSMLTDAVRPFVDHPNQEVSDAAVLALGVLGHGGSAPLLSDLLRDTEAGRRAVGGGKVSERTRAFAAYALGQIGSTTGNEDVRRFAVHHLAHVLVNERAAARDLPVACVVSLGVVRLKPTRGDTAGAAPTASREAQVDVLLELLADPRVDVHVRTYVPVAVARLARDAHEAWRAKAGEALLALLAPGAKTQQPLQQGAVQGLGLLVDGDGEDFDRRARAELLRFATDGDRLGRHLALVALARAASREGTGDDADEAVGSVREDLLRRLARGRTAERPWAAIALGLLERLRDDGGLDSSDDVRRALRAALADNKGPEEAAGIAIASGLLRDLDATVPIAELAASHPDDELRGHAAVALGLLGARSQIPLLRAIVADSRFRPSVLREAATALGMLGDKQVVPLLVEMLGSAKSLYSQASVATALGAIGDARSVEPLTDMVLSDDHVDLSRAFAAVALGIVCDRAPLPFTSRFAVDSSYWLPPPTLHDPLTGNGVLDLL